MVGVHIVMDWRSNDQTLVVTRLLVETQTAVVTDRTFTPPVSGQLGKHISTTCHVASLAKSLQPVDRIGEKAVHHRTIADSYHSEQCPVV